MESPALPVPPNPFDLVRRNGPGLLVAGAVAFLGWILARYTGWPGIVIALVIGMALNPLALRPALKPGYTLAVKKLLRVAIALLGVRIALGDIAALGLGTAALVIVSMAVTLIAGILVARLFGASSAYGALAGGATAVCGASAALAIASVLPKDDRRDMDAAFVVLAVNALSTVAMIVYPLIGHALGYADHVNGIMLGATIHDVAQVVGAGYGVSPEAGDTATIVKLFRVFLLLPVVLIIGLAFAGAEAGHAKAPVPQPGGAFPCHRRARPPDLAGCHAQARLAADGGRDGRDARAARGRHRRPVNPRHGIRASQPVPCRTNGVACYSEPSIEGVFHASQARIQARGRLCQRPVDRGRPRQDGAGHRSGDG
jgi:uncharacterized integral membrane protein (TIGR00698 family)